MTDERMNESEIRIYEVGYLLLPSIPEEQVSGEVATIKKTISDLGGQFISEEDPKLRTLAYEMHKAAPGGIQKFRQAYFGWVKFEIEAHVAPVIKDKLDGNTQVLRHLLIKTVRENTYTPRVVREEKEGEEVPEDVRQQEPQKELDKSIDELVA